MSNSIPSASVPRHGGTNLCGSVSFMLPPGISFSIADDVGGSGLRCRAKPGFPNSCRRSDLKSATPEGVVLLDRWAGERSVLSSGREGDRWRPADRGSECPAVAQKNRVKDFLILVIYRNGLVWSGAGVGSAWRATGFGLRVRRCRQRDTHGYPPNTNLLLVMIFTSVFDVDGRLVCSELPSDGFSRGCAPRSRAASCHPARSPHSRSSCCAPRRRWCRCHQTVREYVRRQGRPACRGLPSVAPV